MNEICMYLRLTRNLNAKKVVQRYELKSKEVNYLHNLTQDIGLNRKGTTKL